jgi:putative transposase
MLHGAVTWGLVVGRRWDDRLMGWRLGYVIARLVVAGLGLVTRSESWKDAEILVLRHQLAVLQRQIGQPRLSWVDRVIITVPALRLPSVRRVGMLITPGMILRWHRRLVTRRWTTTPGRAGRPPTAPGTRRLVRRLAKENPSWGYRRIHGEFLTLGYRGCAATVRPILKAAGTDPAPHRSGPTGGAFPKTQAQGDRRV